MTGLQQQQIEQAIENLKANAFSIVEIVDLETQKPFYVIDFVKDKKIHYLVTQKNTVRRFKKLETAYQLLAQIGVDKWKYEYDLMVNRRGV